MLFTITASHSANFRRDEEVHVAQHSPERGVSSERFAKMKSKAAVERPSSSGRKINGPGSSTHREKKVGRRRELSLMIVT